MIYSLDETLNDQNNLNKLCIDRSLNTSEILSANAYYGNDAIYKLYAGLPNNYPLKIVIPHGIVLGKNYVWEAECTAPLPAVYCYDEERLKEYQKITNKKLFLTASPFVLVNELLKQNQPARKGTLFFPYHSTAHISVESNYSQMAQRLLELDEKFQPVTVCIYWKDYILGNAKPFIERGIPVVSAGHMHDPHFLFRFFHLCSINKYSSGNEFGSHLFYSIKAGCSYFHLPGLGYNLSASSEVICRDGPPVTDDYENTLIDMFSDPHSSPTQEQMAFVNYHLGTQYLKKPDQLRKELLDLEYLDKYYLSWFPLQTKHKVLIPPYFYRSGYRLGEKIYRTVYKHLNTDC